MANIVPIFPLPAVVFPGEPLTLHIFEERFKTMIADCLAGDPVRPFGVSNANSGNIQTRGCLVRIEEVVRRYDDGRLDLITRGARRYDFIAIIEEAPYPKARVTFVKEQREEIDPVLRDHAFTLYMKLIELAKGQPHVEQPYEREKISYMIAHNSGMGLDERQKLLELEKENERLQFLVHYYQQIIPVVVEREEVKARILANGHIRALKGSEINNE